MFCTTRVNTELQEPAADYSFKPEVMATEESAV